LDSSAEDARRVRGGFRSDFLHRNDLVQQINCSIVGSCVNSLEN
jgi:hypothetical protein